MSTTKIITGVLIGAATGAIVGILFAPAKGSKTRKRLMGKKEEYKNSLQEKVDQFVEDLTEQFENTKEQYSELTKKGKEKLNSVKDGHQHTLS